MILESYQGVAEDEKEVLGIILRALDPSSQEQGELVLRVADPDRIFSLICQNFKLIRAGGGYVLNEGGELLMIHRRGFWDLPKGKEEKGEAIEECAVREVEEECGVNDLKITTDAFRTYHVYEEKGKSILKESVWFGMRTVNQDLKPQHEEDIEQAIWVKRPIKPELVQQAYPSIREVLYYFNS